MSLSASSREFLKAHLNKNKIIYANNKYERHSDYFIRKQRDVDKLLMNTKIQTVKSKMSKETFSIKILS